MDDEILGYRSRLSYNREVFLAEHAPLIKAFGVVDANFEVLVQPVTTRRDIRGRSLVSLGPFLLLMQRQSRAAFEAFSVFQGYQGWVLARPGVESALIIGKWLDDDENAKLWEARHVDRKSYSKAYTGAALRSDSLPNSAWIQSVLSRINDTFVHANPEYYLRHLSVAPSDPGHTEVQLAYFDDNITLVANVLAFLRLVLVLQVELATAFHIHYGQEVELRCTIDILEKQFRRTAETVSKSAAAREILSDLGGWVFS